ncbi:MAG: dephospho-CoA kinase [Parcubacteria group bacterium Greene0714_7]|nr:MAG: dephospho-CoA kinase [Parcubacteria group bacterium Greene0714_7]
MILGITGTIGAGKGTVATYLEEKGFRHISVSAFLENEALRRGLVPTRIVCREIANEYRAKHSTALVGAVLGEINSVKENVVVESLHSVPEVLYIRNLGGKVLSVDAPLSVRYERIQRRGEEKDAVSFDDFLKEQNRQMVSENRDENNLKEAIAMADFHIDNAEISEGLFMQIDDILQKIS